MNNQLSNNGWELEKNKLREALEEEVDFQGLAVEQREIIHETILRRLDEGDESDQKWIWFLGWALVGGLKFAFMPSEFMASLVKNNGEEKFWFALALKELAQDAEAIRYINDALHDSSLPRGIRLGSLQLKVWCHVRLGEYAEALAILNELANAVITFTNKYYINYLDGYISALRHFGITAGDMPVHICLDMNGEIGMETTATRVDSLPKGIVLREAEDILRKKQRENTKITESLLDVKPGDENLKTTKTKSWEEYGTKLVTEYGGWVSSLANRGALINAEFLYDALGARSWSEVIAGYSNAVEEEIKANLLPRLNSFLIEKGTTLENILSNKMKIGGSALGYAEAVLKKIAENSVLTSILSALPQDTFSFLLRELPDSIARLRKLRKDAVHGDIVDSAKEIRKLVLGTPKKAGLLKRLNEVIIPYTG